MPGSLLVIDFLYILSCSVFSSSDEDLEWLDDEDLSDDDVSWTEIARNYRYRLLWQLSVNKLDVNM